MPTGHTAKLYDGEDQSFQDFALGCARSFGALITMRDEPADAPIPESFEPDPDSYYARAVKRDTERLAELRSMTLEEARRQAQAERDAIIERNRQWQAESDARRKRYQAMLERAKALRGSRQAGRGSHRGRPEGSSRDEP